VPAESAVWPGGEERRGEKDREVRSETGGQRERQVYRETGVMSTMVSCVFEETEASVAVT
jgi:hypothetical protein